MVEYFSRCSLERPVFAVNGSVAVSEHEIDVRCRQALRQLV